MSHHDKVKCLIAELEAHDIRPSSVVPPIYKWLWGLGVMIAPPHCQHWTGLAALTTATFATMFLILTLIWQWRAPGLPEWVTWTLPLTAGVFFGLLLTSAYRLAATLMKLPTWQDYPRAEGAARAGSMSPWVRCDSWVRLLLAATAIAILAAIVAGVP